MPDFRTKEQAMAQEAYERVSNHINDESFDFDKYSSFALSFPSLIHSCGLVQALAFAQAKAKDEKSKDGKAKREYINDLQAVFNKIDSVRDLPARSRDADVMEYMRITRHAISAASWIKRYCQASD